MKYLRGPSGGFQRSALRPIFGLALRAPRLIFSAFRAPTYDSAPHSNLFSYSHSALQTAPALHAPPFFHHQSPLQSNLYIFVQYHNIWIAYKFVYPRKNISVFLWMCLSLSLLVSLSVCLSVGVCVCLSLGVGLSLSLSGFVFFCVSVSLSVWVSDSGKVSLSLCVIL